MDRRSATESPDPGGLAIVYDGECPFCARYMKLLRLREAAGPVELIDARQDHPVVEAIRAENLDLDEGMVVRMGGRFLHRAEAMTALSVLSTRAGVFNRSMYWLLRNPKRAALLYPWMVRGRNATLRLLGRKPIVDGGTG